MNSEKPRSVFKVVLMATRGKEVGVIVLSGNPMGRPPCTLDEMSTQERVLDSVEERVHEQVEQL